MAADDWRRRNQEFQEPRLSRNLNVRDALRPIAARHGVPVAAVAIAWTLSWPGVSGAIVGARSPEQVDGWIAAGNLTLQTRDLNEMADALRTNASGPPDRLSRRRSMGRHAGRVGPERPVAGSGRRTRSFNQSERAVPGLAQLLSCNLIVRQTVLTMWIVRLALRPALHVHRPGDADRPDGRHDILRMPADMFPQIDIPVVAAIWSYTGLPPARWKAAYLAVRARHHDHRERHRGTSRADARRRLGVKILHAARDPSMASAVAQVAAVSQPILRQLPPERCARW